MAVLNNRLIIKNSILLYFRMFFLMFISLYTSRIVLDVLGIDDFGIYNVVGGIVVLFTFLNNAMSSATQRYLTYELGRGNLFEIRRVFETSFLIHLIIALCVIILSETIGLYFFYEYMNIPIDRMDAAFWVFQCSVLSTAILILTVPYTATIIAYEKMQTFAYISILEVILKLLIVYVLMSVSFDKLKIYAFLMLAVQLVVSFIYHIYCKKRFDTISYNISINRALFKNMTSFALWNLIGNISAIAFTQGINVLLNVFFGPALNAARGIAVQVQTSVNGFCYNFQTALNPQITKTFASGEKESMFTLICRSSKFSFYLLYIVSLPLLLETSYVLELWLKEVPDCTVVFVRLMLCISLIESLANPIMISVMATGKIKTYQLIVGGILLLIVPFSYIALKITNLPAIVFVVHLFMAIIAQMGRLYFMRILLGFSLKIYFRQVFYKIILISIISVVLPVVISNTLQYGLFRVVLVVVTSILSVCFSVMIFGLENEEKKFLYSKLKILKHC